MGDGKSEKCLILAELELDTCWDRHPCSSAGEHRHAVRLHRVKVHLAVAIVAVPQAHPGQGWPVVI